MRGEKFFLPWVSEKPAIMGKNAHLSRPWAENPHPYSDLKEFSNHSGDNDIPDSVYGQNHFAPSIIIDEISIRSVRPGYGMDNDMMNFGLSW